MMVHGDYSSTRTKLHGGVWKLTTKHDDTTRNIERFCNPILLPPRISIQLYIFQPIELL